MLRTNCKKVKQAVQKYILECAKNGLQELIGKNGITEQAVNKHPISIINHCFHNELKWMIARDGEFNAFKYWLNSLGGCWSVHPIYNDLIRDLIQNWLEETDEESEQYSDDKLNALFVNLVAREFFTILHKEQLA